MSQTSRTTRFARLVTMSAAATAAALGLSSCSDNTTGPGGGDSVLPRVTLTVPSARLDTIDVNTALTVNLTASDNFALRQVIARVAVDGGATLANDTTTFTGAQASFSKSLSVSMLGVGRGRRILLEAQSIDAGQNRSTIAYDTLFTVDTLGPVVTINGPAAGRVFVRGDTIPIDITTADGSGVAHNGYILARVNAPGDTVVVQRDSLAPVAATATQRNLFRYVVPNNAIAGTYVVRGFGRDASTLTTTTANFVALTIRDQTPPTATLLAPAADTLISANDTSVVVRVQAGDNTGLVRVRVFGFAIRGDPAFGRVDTLVRFSDNFAPSTGNFRPNLTDTTVTRRLRPVNHSLTAPETVFVAVEALDESGNSFITTRRAIIAPNRFTQDQAPPGITVLEPADLATLPLGEPVRIRARLTDNFALKRLSVVGINIRGDPSLQRRDTTVWFDTVLAPNRTSNNDDVYFPAPGGVAPDTVKRDTTVVRDLIATGQLAEDTLTLVFRVTDWADRTTEFSRKTVLRRGPSTIITSPLNGVATFRGDRLSVSVRAQASNVSRSPLRRIGFRITGTFGGLTTWAPAEVDSIITGSGVTTAVITREIQVPLSSTTIPDGAIISISPYATDEANPSLIASGPAIQLTVNTPPVDLLPPLVYNLRVDPRVERQATFQFRGRDPGGLARLGYRLQDASTNATLLADSVSFTGLVPDSTVTFAPVIPDSLRGRRFKVTAFAVDAAGNRGGSVPASSNVPSPTAVDTTRGLFTYGQTFVSAAIDSSNPVADIAVDNAGNAFLSNINLNRVEYWQQSTGAFRATPIPVGAQPWGMSLNRTGDTLFVANSGATNISRVPLTGPNALTDAPGSRIRTPNTLLYRVATTVDEAGTETIGVVEAFQFSDRPQFVGFSANNSVYYSTRPTETSSPGTIRRLLRNPVRNEAQFLTTYAQDASDQPWVIANADSAARVTYPGIVSATLLVIFDRPLFGADNAFLTDSIWRMANTDGAVQVAFRSNRATLRTAGFTINIDSGTVPGVYGNSVSEIVGRMRARGSDVTARRFSIDALNLTDTTFVAHGGTGQYVAFGEGNGPLGSRVITIREPIGSDPIGSAAVSVNDLTGNAADRVFGLAIDSLNREVVANGSQMFFAALDTSALFNLRLEGAYKTTLPGAGVAFHPQYVGPTSAVDRRVAFVAQGDSSIAVVDAYNYVLRRVLPLRSKLYGPIRAVLPTPAEQGADPQLRVKIYALSREGLVVIPIRAADLN
ncbi:MAG: hypothetical protein SFW08_00365 [Gemmatimonadaceae bacterium]|nr:hypothetical protein [Gemmatimonadaceae bacterium]